jgi:hypothetical protein
MDMSSDEAQDASQEVAPTRPARLTRRALFDLRLEEMRQRGEPTEGMSQLAPTMSFTTEDSDERAARVFALCMANGVHDDSPWMIAENKRLEQEAKERQEEWDREEVYRPQHTQEGL